MNISSLSSVRNILQLDDPIVKGDTMYLLDNNNYWSTIFEIYNEIDTISQYDICLRKKCKEMKIDEQILTRMTNPLRYFLTLLLLEKTTLKDFKEHMKSLEHDNKDKFIKFIENKYTDLLPKLLLLNNTRNHLNQHNHYILNDFSVSACNTNIIYGDISKNIPMILFTISDKTYQCTIKDIEFILDQLKIVTKNE